MFGQRVREVKGIGFAAREGGFLASSAFQTTTPSTQAVMTSAKATTTTAGDMRRNSPSGFGSCRSAWFALMTVPDPPAGNTHQAYGASVPKRLMD